MARFVKGSINNPTGRPKGTKNKYRVNVVELLADKKCNPFLILAELALTAKSDYCRLQAASELAAYVQPKLKHVQVTHEGEQPLMINLIMAPKRTIGIE